MRQKHLHFSKYMLQFKVQLKPFAGFQETPTYYQADGDSIRGGKINV